jgi:hypothetical protein
MLIIGSGEVLPRRTKGLESSNGSEKADNQNIPSQ